MANVIRRTGIDGFDEIFEEMIHIYKHKQNLTNEDYPWNHFHRESDKFDVRRKELVKTTGKYFDELLFELANRRKWSRESHEKWVQEHVKNNKKAIERLNEVK